MIKIASLVSYRIVPPVTGGEKGIYYFLEGISGFVAVDCFTVEENRDLGIKNIRVFPLLGCTSQKLRYINPFLFFSMKKICKQQGIRHLVIEHPYYGWLGVLLQYFGGIKLIVHSHNIESTRFRTLKKSWWRLLFLYERFVHKKAALNFFISENDRQFGIDTFGLLPGKTMLCTYGIQGLQPTSVLEKAAAKKKILERYQLNADTLLLLFNGTLSYKPNLDAVIEIIEQINPLLQKRALFQYQIIICGKGLPGALNELTAYREQNIIYAGFVDEIKIYFDAADLFINPVTDGGGIKTKLVEALAAGALAVSYTSGATGVPEQLTGGCLRIVKDGKAEAFSAAVIDMAAKKSLPLPTVFFDHFSWNNITRKAAEAIEAL